MKILVIDAYYRHISFACEAALKNYEIDYVDLTSKFGSWSPEDWEGPFGFFQEESLLAQQDWFMRSSYSTQTQTQGFVVHADGFPLEFKGPLLEHHLVSKFDSSVESFIKEGTKHLEYTSLLKSWPSLVGVISAATLTEPPLKDSLPLFQDYNLRYPLRKDFPNLLSKAKSLNVNILDAEEFIQGLSSDSLESYKFVVNAVNSESFADIFTQETESNLAHSRITPLNRTKINSLYPEVIKPDWHWVRYSFLMESIADLKEWPLSFTYIPQLNEPWRESNFMVLRKTKYLGWWDIWLKIPYLNLYDSAFYHAHREKITFELGKLIPQLKILEFRLPTQSVERAKGVPFPIYSKPCKIKKTNDKFYHLTEEALVRFDLDFRFKAERDLLLKLMKQTQKEQ